MKSKLFSLITGLLMAASVASYGQEIVSEFTFQNGNMISNTDLVECSDGTLLTAIAYYNDYDYETVLLVCKITPDGQLVDSVVFDYGHLFSIHGAVDHFVITRFLLDDDNNTEIFRMIFIDADLNVTETRDVPIFSGLDPDSFLVDDELILTPDGDFVISYWTDVVMQGFWVKDGVFHLMRISLDGTIVAESETEQVLPPNWGNMHPGDSALAYYSQGFGILEESPRVYYKMGGYLGLNSDHPWPLIAYTFDENLSLTNSVVYKYIDEDTYFDWAGHEHFVPFAAGTYLMAAQIHYPEGIYRTSMVKFDMDNHPMVIKSVESLTAVGSPVKTVVVDENTIYHAYQTHNGYNISSLVVVRLDNDLNKLWDVTLSGGQANYAYGQCLKVLQNGDIAMVFFTSFSNGGDQFHLSIIHDGYDNTQEMTDMKKPFTFNPNPVKGQLNLHFVEGSEPASVEIQDLTGRVVATKLDGSESIDLSEMPSGVYLLHVTMKDGGTYNEKIVRE